MFFILKTLLSTNLHLHLVNYASKGIIRSPNLVRNKSRLSPALIESIHINGYHPYRRFGQTCSDNASKDTFSIKHLYHEDCENAVNTQILGELNASYAYLALSSYFGQPDIALPGCNGYFLKMHREELDHAYVLIKYQHIRGGQVKFCPLTCIESMKFSVKKALEISLELEKKIKEKLIAVHDIAEKHHDLNLMDIIVTKFIDEQERTIFEIGRLLSRINKMSTGCGCSEFLFDREVHKAFVRKTSNVTELDNDLLVYK